MYIKNWGWGVVEDRGGAIKVRRETIFSWEALCLATAVASPTCRKPATNRGNNNDTTSFYGSSCANNGKGALNTPETLPLLSPCCVQFPTFSHCSPLGPLAHRHVLARVGAHAQGQSRLDLYHYDHQKALVWGRRRVQVQVVRKAPYRQGAK
eukprot:1194445-Prorocentrum_minimum.AAC.2